MFYTKTSPQQVTKTTSASQQHRADLDKKELNPFDNVHTNGAAQSGASLTNGLQEQLQGWL